MSGARTGWMPSECAVVRVSAVIRFQPQRGGWLEVVCGPMFSGKSEELIRRLRRAEIAGQRALIVKPLVDDRYDVGHVVSHAGAKMRAVTASSGAEVLRLASGYDAVGIDEVQFFDEGIVDSITALVNAARASSPPGSRRTSAASRSARCRRCSASRSSSTSSRPSAIGAAGPRRSRSGSSTGTPPRTTARRFRSAHSTRTRRAVDTAIR